MRSRLPLTNIKFHQPSCVLSTVNKIFRVSKLRSHRSLKAWPWTSKIPSERQRGFHRFSSLSFIFAVLLHGQTKSPKILLIATQGFNSSSPRLSFRFFWARFAFFYVYPFFFLKKKNTEKKVSWRAPGDERAQIWRQPQNFVSRWFA